MPRRVQVGGTIHEFPDSATDDQIAEALANQPASGSPATEQPSALKRGLSELYAKSPIQAAVGAIGGAMNVVAHPLDTYLGALPIAQTIKDAAKAQWDQAIAAAQKAKDAARGGVSGTVREGALSASEALGHGLAAVLPILGPAAADVGEHGARGDLAGMTGGAVGLLAPFAAKYGLELKNQADPRGADLLRRDAEQTVSQRVLAPGNPKFKGTAERIAPEVLSRGMQGNRLQLQQLADEGMADAGDRIDTAIAAANWKAGPAGNMIKGAPIVQELNDRIDQFKVNGTVIPTAAGKVKQLTALRDYVNRLGADVPFDAIRKVRDEFYSTADAAKGYQGPDVNVPDVGWAAREAGSAIRSGLAEQRPELVGPNADFTFFKRLGDVLDPTLGRPKNVTAAPSGVMGGQSTAGAVIGAAAAAGSHVPGLQGASALVASRLLPALLEARNSPAWQLAGAAKKMKLADAIERGDMGLAHSRLMTLMQGAPRQNGQDQP